RRGQFVKHAEDASESDPSLVIFRAELEGAQVSDRRFVRPIESQIRFREEDPQPPVFVVAGDALQERLDCRLEPRLPEDSKGGLGFFGTSPRMAVKTSPPITRCSTT